MLRQKAFTQAGIVWKKFLNALPVICFYLFLFYTVLVLFGSRYIMVVSLVTVLFQTNYRKRKSWNSLFYLVFIQLFISVLSYAATLSAAWTVILNLLVPCGVILLKSSRFNKMGYFSSLMTFTFLQLLPVDAQGFAEQTKALVYCLVCFLVLVRIYQWRYPQEPDYQRAQKGLGILSECLRQQLSGKEHSPEADRALFQLQQLQYKEAYLRRGNKEVVSFEGKISYIFALLFQRASYFLRNRFRKEMLEQEEARRYLDQTACFLEHASHISFQSKADRKRLEKEGRSLLLEAKRNQEELYVSVRNFLRPFLLILRKFDEKEENIDGVLWSTPKHRRPIGKILYQIRPDGFEIRFALRMSAVLTLSFLFVRLSGADHSYWLPLNAFLLLRPMYEDSQYRIRTRFMGTMLGCLILAALFPVLHGMTGHFVLATVMVVCMYTATPGTWVHALYVTCFALSMVTLAMREMTAIDLRVAYVMAATLLVLVINQFFFPTSMGHQFRYNFAALFHIHHMYLRMFEDAIEMPLDYGMICDAQMEYHMVHEQMWEHVQKKEGKLYQDCRNMLDLSWRMIAEMEQILFLVNTEKRGQLESDTLKNYIAHAGYVLSQIQTVLGLKGETYLPEVQETGCVRNIKNEPEFSYLLTAYAKNLSGLYRLAWQNRRNK